MGSDIKGTVEDEAAKDDPRVGDKGIEGVQKTDLGVADLDIICPPCHGDHDRTLFQETSHKHIIYKIYTIIKNVTFLEI